jgi:26S proteasome non-ATPase regulatory subunit 10
MTDRISDPRFYQLRDAASSAREEAERLIAADPSILEAKSGIGETAFHYVVVEDALEIAEFLRANGSTVDTTNDFGDTPFVDAASLGWLDMCQYLISHGANFRYINPASGESAFSRAGVNKQVEVLEYLIRLLKSDEDINHFISDTDAEVIFENCPSSAALLIKRGLKKRWTDE